MGLFSNSYNKPGPGVKKNERKKKGFFAFFEIYFRNFWGLFCVSVVYTIISLVTLGFGNGLAKVGITHVARSAMREKHSFLVSDFADAIKKNWKQALGIGILNMVILALLGLDIWYFWGYITNPEIKELAIFQILGLGLSLAFFIVFTFIKYYIWTMTITFSLTVKQMVKNSFHFSFLGIARNVMMAVIMAVIYVGLYLLAVINAGLFVVAIVIAVGIVPGFKAMLVQANVFPPIKKYMIDPYYAEHKGEDIEKRRALGLEIGEDELPPDEASEDAIFTDTHSQSKEDN